MLAMFGIIFALSIAMRSLTTNITRKLKALTLTCVCLCFYLLASAGVLEDVTTCFKTGKVATIEEHLGANCEINIDGEKSSVSKMQAKLLLEGFFSKNTPVDFTISTSNTLAGSKYAVGKLSTSAGKFDVYITFDASDSNVINSIKINS
jgi:hypothetical protein